LTARHRSLAIVRGMLYTACQRGTRMYRWAISGDKLNGHIIGLRLATRF